MNAVAATGHFAAHFCGVRTYVQRRHRRDKLHTENAKMHLKSIFFFLQLEIKEK